MFSVFLFSGQSHAWLYLILDLRECLYYKDWKVLIFTIDIADLTITVSYLKLSHYSLTCTWENQVFVVYRVYYNEYWVKTTNFKLKYCSYRASQPEASAWYSFYGHPADYLSDTDNLDGSEVSFSHGWLTTVTQNTRDLVFNC